MLDLPMKSIEQSPNFPDLEDNLVNQDLMDEGSQKNDRFIVLCNINL